MLGSRFRGWCCLIGGLDETNGSSLEEKSIFVVSLGFREGLGLEEDGLEDLRIEEIGRLSEDEGGDKVTVLPAISP